MPRTATTTLRVYYMPASLIDSWRSARDRQGTTNLAFVADATDKHLAPLVKELRGVGMMGRSTERCAVRLPVPMTTLADLGEASEQTGIPGATLLSICLSRASASSAKRRRSVRRAH